MRWSPTIVDPSQTRTQWDRGRTRNVTESSNIVMINPHHAMVHQQSNDARYMTTVSKQQEQRHVRSASWFAYQR